MTVQQGSRQDVSVSASASAFAFASAITEDDEDVATALVSTIAIVLASSAVLFVTTVPLLQMDAVSRLILSPERLYAKRRSEHVYRYQKGLDAQVAKVRALIQGAVTLSLETSQKKRVDGGGAESDTEASESTLSVDAKAWRYNPREESIQTELLIDRTECESLAEEILSTKGPSGRTSGATANGTATALEPPRIVTIDMDPSDERSVREWYLYLAFPPSHTASGSGGSGGTVTAKKWRRVQVPLVPFCRDVLAPRFDDDVTSLAMCFVADASSGLGTEVLCRCAAKCGIEEKSIIREPTWMTALSLLVQTHPGALSRSALDRVLFALCRLEAFRVQDDAGPRKTVVFALPGQSSVPTLLPPLQRAFPHERHVFVYDSCVEAVELAISALSGGVEAKTVKVNAGDGTANDGAKMTRKRRNPIDDAFTYVAAMPSSITATTPLSPLRSLSKLPDALSALSSDVASVVEAWMGSVDAVLGLKGDESSNGYVPFVCRLGFLLGRTGTLGNGDVDVVDLALANVMQYVTGTRSRPLEESVMEGARSELRRVKEEYRDGTSTKEKSRRKKKTRSLTEAERRAIEECVFEHKGILIQDKTLMDTVQPKKEWSLKAARKLTGCACCALEEEEEEEEEKNANSRDGDQRGFGGGAVDMSVPGAFASSGLTKRSGKGGSSGGGGGVQKSNYVDGKSTFG